MYSKANNCRHCTLIYIHTQFKFFIKNVQYQISSLLRHLIIFINQLLSVYCKILDIP